MNCLKTHPMVPLFSSRNQVWKKRTPTRKLNRNRTSNKWRRQKTKRNKRRRKKQKKSMTLTLINSKVARTIIRQLFSHHIMQLSRLTLVALRHSDRLIIKLKTLHHRSSMISRKVQSHLILVVEVFQVTLKNSAESNNHWH